MSDLIERAFAFKPDGCHIFCTGTSRCSQCMATFVQSERTRIAAELEALSQKTFPDDLVVALLEYVDGLRGKK